MHDSAPSHAKDQGATINDESDESSDKIKEKLLRNERFCSFEVFSAQDSTVETYRQLFSELDSCLPLFYSVTWHSSTCDIPIEIHPSLKCFERYSKITLLHLPAKGLSRRDVIHVLNRVVKTGKTNIFALQGDFDNIDEHSKEVHFPHAIDLVKFIRSEYGTKFTICVAGYPQIHPLSTSKETDILYLKAKIDAGANFIITQMIFESKVFVEFVRDCRSVGITVPVIPGIFLIPSYNSLIKVARNCKAKIPHRILQDLESIKNDRAAIQEYGIQLSTSIVKEIFESGAASGFHLFTLNKWQSAVELCERLNLRKAVVQL